MVKNEMPYTVNTENLDIQNKSNVDTFICLNSSNQYVIQANLQTIIKNPDLQISQLKEKIKELKIEILKLGGVIF